MKIAFFLGSVDISGGSYVIYQHALYARLQGHEVTIIAQWPFTRQQLKWHPATRELNFIHIDAITEDTYFDLAVATWWKTAIELHRLKARQYAYFVQSIESRFYPEPERPLRDLVDSTYRLPLPGITEASWIRDYLKSQFGHSYQLARNGIRKDLYCSDGIRISERPPAGQLRILVEGPFGVFFKNVGRTLKVVRKATPHQTWLLTSSDLSWYPTVDRLFSRVPIDKVAEIYRSCDVIVKLSYVEGMFGPPLEMFHCGGTAIVYDVTGHDEYIVHGENGLVVPRDDEAGVISAIKRLQQDEELLSTLKSGAAETAAAWPNWDSSSQHFLTCIENIMSFTPVSRDELRELNHKAMAIYTQDESVRLETNRYLKWRYRAHSMVSHMPSGIARQLRLARYIIEMLR